VGDHTVAVIHYHGCTNYEGEKVLVYRHTSVKRVTRASFLDPHFCDSDNHLSPFARFAPTRAGWAAALTCARSLR
jgi:hypothetical protein